MLNINQNNKKDMSNLGIFSMLKLFNIAKRLSEVERENIALRKDRDIQKSLIEKQQEKIKQLREKIQDISFSNNEEGDDKAYMDKVHEFYPKARSSSQKRTKRGSSQKRDYSSKKRVDKQTQILSILEKEIGANDYYDMIQLPVEVPYVENEERRCIAKLIDSYITPKDDSKINIVMIKSIARIKSLNKICHILKNELSLSNEKISSVVKKYQKAVEEGAESDRRLIVMQRELSASKYNSNLNSTNLSNGNYDLESTNIMFNRKFSQTVDGKLSNTVLGYNDSRIDRSNFMSPSREYKTERFKTDCDFSQINYSPSSNVNRVERDSSQTRPRYHNMFNTKYVFSLS